MEMNFDGIVGPTHHYGGLAYGNIASELHRHHASNPKEAALQGLAKMKHLADLGIKQGVIPPQERPLISGLRSIGYLGHDADVVTHAYRDNPSLLSLCCSASAMWTANSATIAPSADTDDKKVHITPANLISNFHRSLETDTTARLLQAIFPNPNHFVHHSPLPATTLFSDEGAANHSRLCLRFDEPGIQLFAYGRRELPGHHEATSKKYPGRQTLEASQAIARLHQLEPDHTIFVQQNPEAIDQGVFHNDVIAVANGSVLLYHQEAFANSSAVIDNLSRKFRKLSGADLIAIQVTSQQLSVPEAVSSYLFNSQLITLPDLSMMLVCPSECEENSRARAVIQQIIDSNRNPISKAIYLNLRQSMNNGGGPACLRLRVALNKEELAAVSPHVVLNKALYDKLTAWVNKHYRDRLTLQDLADPQLIKETRTALDQLTQLLRLGTPYPFQRP